LKRYLIVKLLAINLLVIGFVMVIVWVAVDTLAAGYFVTLMEKYHISPEPAHEMFVSAVHRYLVWACLAAMILAVVLSFVMMRRVLSPLTRMTGITHDIAAGNFKVRVPASSQDEVGQLTAAFNQMAASLEALENQRRTLMIDVAHELRTPLTNIRGYLEALNDRVVPPSTATFALLQDECLRLVKLVEDVLQLARADAAAHSLDLQTVQLNRLITEVHETFGPLFARRSVTVKISTPPKSVTLVADRNRLFRILRNLFANAARYAPSGTQVDVDVIKTTQGIKTVFSNQADHLSKTDVPYLFERFFRGEKSRSRQHGGAGIGLAIVKELVEAHGGSVGANLDQQRIHVWFKMPIAPAASHFVPK
jgi:signal transduction histidine kinase